MPQFVLIAGIEQAGDGWRSGMRHNNHSCVAIFTEGIIVKIVQAAYHYDKEES